ncbi:MAG: glycine cleavage system protein H [Alphaproteobacteria bacterium]
MVPEELQYTESHEWCLIDEGHALVGVTEYGLTRLGDLTYVELPDVDDDILCGVAFGSIGGTRNSKSLLSPLDGLVVEINERAAHNPDIVFDDPYNDGWLIRIRLDESAEHTELLTAAEYYQRVRRTRRR